MPVSADFLSRPRSPWGMLARSLCIGAVLMSFTSGGATLAQDRFARPTTPETRVALVIGNSAYSGTPFASSANDAKAMANFLRDLGWMRAPRFGFAGSATGA